MLGLQILGKVLPKDLWNILLVPFPLSAPDPLLMSPLPGASHPSLQEVPMRKAVEDGTGVGVPVTHVGDLEEVSNFRVQPGQALAIVGGCWTAPADE